MTHDVERPENSPGPVSDEELIAYLDGELSADASRDMERRMSEDAALRQRLKQHQMAWDLLEEVSRAEVSEKFTRSTIEMVAVTVTNDVQQLERRARRRRRWAWLAAAAVWLVIALAGYALTTHTLSRSNRELVQDLPIIEHLDAYRNAENIEFLRALARDDLFTAEVEENGP